ncbi:MAG: zinc-dependent alcohol dehydrogenase family protein [Halieaceae bacterium]|jgi:alcohol dehydrogenase, propanol-preferring|nr:zinc-dependent alcohol dehydrogenase family protein [Halieaceae bacterium]
MRAMVMKTQGAPLELCEMPIPQVTREKLLIRVSACGICRTDLHVMDGDLTEPTLPLIPGHQIVGYVEQVGDGVTGFSPGQRVGVPWLGGSCGHCEYCLEHRENLCDDAVYTGYQINGGFAEYTVADAGYCFSLPDNFSDNQAAPLLCAGLIGYRAYRPAMAACVLGLYGFGAAAHILIQVAKYRGQTVFAFTREADKEAQSLARKLGADWVGDSGSMPPRKMDAAIIFAPAGELVPASLKAVRKGGKVICAGIHMSDIPSFPYADLWHERSIQSIANLTRKDGEEFLPLASAIPINTEVHLYRLDQANNALADLRAGRFSGAAVVTMKNPD